MNSTGGAGATLSTSAARCAAFAAGFAEQFEVFEGAWEHAVETGLVSVQESECGVTERSVKDAARRASSAWHYCVPKLDLITRLQVILQRGGLKIAEGMPELAALQAGDGIHPGGD